MKNSVMAAALSVALMFASMQAWAQNYRFTEASDLNLIGKILPTPNPYHRVDTVKYKGFTKSENNQVRCSAGLAVLFETNSKNIVVKTHFGYQYQGVNTMPIAYRGYDLYILEGDRWVWAGNGASANGTQDVEVKIVENMDGTMHKCLMYLPNYSEIISSQIGVDADAIIKPMESPFRHRIAIFGSSYTHGISTSRSGMSYPMQFMRRTGLQMLSLGCSGNSKLQPYFATVLEDVDADAFIFDAFSNPDAKTIEERLEPFIQRMIAAHPGKPLIFQQTIRRENRNYNTAVQEKEEAKVAMAEKLMKEYCKKYEDVYFIHPKARGPYGDFAVDGIHPDDYGYYLWEQSVEKDILKILKKYGIK